MSGRSSMYPFTAAQWQELELQALFFKFMVSGHPIPPDLIFSIHGKSSFTIQSQNIGWTWFQMGLSSKLDPEPTRCRRTDGKKWRCSRQAFGDSKYCERHMHRGKSCPRKPVESKPLQTQSPETQSNLTSLSSVTSDMTHNHLSNTHHPKPVKDPNFMTFLGIDSGWSPPKLDHKLTSHQRLFSDGEGLIDTSMKRQRIMYQFIEESPQEKRDSWLDLVI